MNFWRNKPASRRRDKFEHRTSIFEGAYRAWSHLGGIDPLDLETKTSTELDPLDFPLEDDPRDVLGKTGGGGSDDDDDDRSDDSSGAGRGDGAKNEKDDRRREGGRRQHPYEPLPRSGLAHPFVTAILFLWNDPEPEFDAERDTLNNLLTVLRTWWQHRRHGETGSAVQALGANHMRGVVEGHTRHFFKLAYNLVVDGMEDPPRTLRDKMRRRQKKTSKKRKRWSDCAGGDRGECCSLLPLEDCCIHCLRKITQQAAISSVDNIDAIKAADLAHQTGSVAVQRQATSPVHNVRKEDAVKAGAMAHQGGSRPTSQQWHQGAGVGGGQMTGCNDQAMPASMIPIMQLAMQQQATSPVDNVGKENAAEARAMAHQGGSGLNPQQWQRGVGVGGGQMAGCNDQAMPASMIAMMQLAMQQQATSPVDNDGKEDAVKAGAVAHQGGSRTSPQQWLQGGAVGGGQMAGCNNQAMPASMIPMMQLAMQQQTMSRVDNDGKEVAFKAGALVHQGASRATPQQWQQGGGVGGGQMAGCNNQGMPASMIPMMQLAIQQQATSRVDDVGKVDAVKAGAVAHQGVSRPTLQQWQQGGGVGGGQMAGHSNQAMPNFNHQTQLVMQQHLGGTPRTNGESIQKESAPSTQENRNITHASIANIENYREAILGNNKGSSQDPARQTNDQGNNEDILQMLIRMTAQTEASLRWTASNLEFAMNCVRHLKQLGESLDAELRRMREQISTLQSVPRETAGGGNCEDSLRRLEERAAQISEAELLRVSERMSTSRPAPSGGGSAGVVVGGMTPAVNGVVTPHEAARPQNNREIQQLLLRHPLGQLLSRPRDKTPESDDEVIILSVKPAVTSDKRRDIGVDGGGTAHVVNEGAAPDELSRPQKTQATSVAVENDGKNNGEKTKCQRNHIDDAPRTEEDVLLNPEGIKHRSGNVDDEVIILSVKPAVTSDETRDIGVDGGGTTHAVNEGAAPDKVSCPQKTQDTSVAAEDDGNNSMEKSKGQWKDGDNVPRTEEEVLPNRESIKHQDGYDGIKTCVIGDLSSEEARATSVDGGETTHA